MIDVDYILSNLREKLGVRLRITNENFPDRTEIIIRPQDFDNKKGFSIVSVIRWLNLKTYLRFDAYCGDMLDTIMSQHRTKVDIMIDNIKCLKGKKGDITLLSSLNGKDLTDLTIDFDLKNINLTLETTTIKQDVKSINEYIIDHQITLLSLILLLFELEEDYFPEYNLVDDVMEGESEGKLLRVEVNKYERSRVNRQACLNYHGYSCKICGFNFEKRYGKIGKNYIHVHHLIPISSIKEVYVLNPIKDLIPICPNCHAIIHRSKEPLSISRLRELLK